MATVPYVSDSGKLELKDFISFVYGNSLNVARNAKQGAGCEARALVIRRNMIDFGSEGVHHVQAVVIPQEYKKRLLVGSIPSRHISIFSSQYLRQKDSVA